MSATRGLPGMRPLLAATRRAIDLSRTDSALCTRPRCAPARPGSH
ncbi:hypothetical protein ACFXPX_23635 [Kitasatospora sp. NPDC059146]